jgi:hypothetical protein
MPRPEINGSLLPFLQSETDRFDPARGFIYTAIFRGLSDKQIQDLQSDYVRGGVACSVTTSHGVSVLEVEDSTQQYTLDTWQLDGNEERIDGFSHPTLISIFGTDTGVGGGADNFASLRTDLENQVRPSDLIQTLVSDGFSEESASTVARFYSLNQRGSPEFENDAFGGGYVLKHITNAPNRWNSNIADFGVGMIYSTAQLLSEIRDSGLWILPCPARLVYKIAHIPAPAPQANYFWGWRKSRSSESNSANNRIDIMQRYTLELWSLDYYQSY